MQDFDPSELVTTQERIPTLEELIQSAPGEYLQGQPFVTEGGKIRYLSVVDTVRKLAA